MAAMTRLLRRRPVRSGSRLARGLLGLALATTAGLLVAACGPADAAGEVETASALTAAATLYESGRYAEAADAYAWLERRGLRDADLLYNQGLAQAQAGPERIGLAILAHERALRLRPRDADLRDRLSELRRESGAAAPRAAGFWARIERSRTWVSDVELAWTMGLLWNLVVLLFFAWRAKRGQEAGSERSVPDRRLGIALVALAMPLTALGLRSWQHAAQPASIVVDAEARLLPVPGPPSPDAPERPLPPGTLVRVLDEREGYLRVAVGDSDRAWIPESSVEAIDRR